MINNTTLYYKKEFSHPVEKVYKAFTTPQHMLCWWTINNFKIVKLELDFIIGGRYAIEMELPNGHTFSIEGIYTEIIPNETIAYTFNYVNFPKQAPAESLVTVNFETTELGTTVHLKQVFKTRPEDMDGRTKVWETMLEKLAVYLENAL